MGGPCSIVERLARLEPRHSTIPPVVSFGVANLMGCAVLRLQAGTKQSALAGLA